MRIKITRASAALVDIDNPRGKWRGVVEFGSTGTIEIVRDTCAEAWAFCQKQIDRENSENE